MVGIVSGTTYVLLCIGCVVFGYILGALTTYLYHCKDPTHYHRGRH